MEEKIIERILNEGIRIAKLAGSKIKQLRENNEYDESLKHGYELVTSADLASDKIIKLEISKVFPGHKFISEESAIENDFVIKEPTWIIDPIDGTVGYANDQYQVAKNHSELPESLNCYKVLISSPDIFDEMGTILASVI